MAITAAVLTAETSTAGGPFESIESAQQYLAVMTDVLDDARGFIQSEINLASDHTADRRLDLLHLIDYKLGQLRHHFTTGSRTLNDLRTLRRLFLNERTPIAR